MKRPFFFVALFLAFSLSTCSLRRYEGAGKKKAQIPCLKKIVIIGFRPISPIFKGSSFVRSPISGNTFRGGKVSEDIATCMTEFLVERISEERNLELITPDIVKKEFLDIHQVIDSTYRKDILLEYIKQIGKTFDADAVILGYVFRWEERVGSDFSSISPASVAFGLYLIDTEKGEVIWKNEFDKTQQSLSENLLEIKTFIKGKGRWLTAEGLAKIGLSEMVKKLLKTQRGCKR